jgi:hypothetical protein
MYDERPLRPVLARVMASLPGPPALQGGVWNLAYDGQEWIIIRHSRRKRKRDDDQGLCEERVAIKLVSSKPQLRKIHTPDLQVLIYR